MFPDFTACLFETLPLRFSKAMGFAKNPRECLTGPFAERQPQCRMQNLQRIWANRKTHLAAMREIDRQYDVVLVIDAVYLLHSYHAYRTLFTRMGFWNLIPDADL